MNLIILLAFFLSGASALTYEVTWTRALSLILGSTTYALSTMLSTFMAGLAIGAFIGGRLADKSRNLILLFGIIEFFIGVFGLITIPMINQLPPLYFKMYKAFHLSLSNYFFFQFLLCASIMLIPTTLMGATFPVVSKQLTTDIKEVGKSVGNVYTFNTFGAILGAFSSGFILIPAIGVRMTTISAVFLNIIVAIMMIIFSRVKLKGNIIAASIIVFGTLLTLTLASEGYEGLINYYTAKRYESFRPGHPTILFNKEYREGRVKVFGSENGYIRLQVRGKLEGTDAGDIPNTLLLAYLPIASHQAPRSFLNIGLGAGVTLGAAKEHLKDVYLVEVNEGVIDAIRAFGPAGLLDGINIDTIDARNYFLLTEKRFDIISSEPSYPTDAGPGNLFTKEFYEIAAFRLNPGGIFCQWLPYYQLSNDDVTMMIKTFGTVFKYTYLWKVSESMDLIMVGSKTPFKKSSEEIIERVNKLNKRYLPLEFVLSRTPEQVSGIVRSFPNIPLNEDDKPILEFHAARNLITDIKD